MPIEPRELVGELTDRRHDYGRVLDFYGNLRERYGDWKDRAITLDSVLAGDWVTIWPDEKTSQGNPLIPNFPRLAIEHRARLIASTWPSMVCPAVGGEKAKAAAEKRERIQAGYHYLSRTKQQMIRWGMDAMTSGVTVCQVGVDTRKPKAQRFPEFKRIDPRYCFPGRAFTQGPFVDDLIVAFEENAWTVARMFGLPEADMKSFIRQSRQDRVMLIKYWDDKYAGIICTPLGERRPNQAGYLELVPMTEHKMSCCPVAIGTRPTWDGVYRGDFDDMHAVLNTLNRFVRLHLDSAIRHVYPERLVFDIENPDEVGPDVDLIAQSREARVEYIVPSGGRFENHQLMRMLTDFGRVSAMLPPSVTGDPNESIISAAGIAATQSQPLDHVKSIQRDCIAPMMQAANELAFEADQVHGDADKEIYGVVGGKAFTEKYRPSKDIAGNVRNEVNYGFASGLDEVNMQVLIQNLRNSGLLSKRKALEFSPLSQDPTEEEKQMAREALQDALFAGIVEQARLGLVSAEAVAKIMQDLEKGGVSLQEAVLEHVGSLPMAQPEGSAAGPAGVPGIAGAAAPGNSFSLPALNSVMAGDRP